MRTFFIYRRGTFLGAFTGTRSQAEIYAWEQWGIDCSVVPYTESGTLT